MLAILYGVVGALCAIVTASALGVPLLRLMRVQLVEMEARLLAIIFGSAILSALVYALCRAQLARKGIFLIAGLLAVAVAVFCGALRRGNSSTPLPSTVKWIFGIAFILINVYYVVHALTPLPAPDALTARLSAVERAHGLPTPAGMDLSGFEFLSLFAFVIGRHSAFALVDVCLLAALSLLVLFFSHRLGHPLIGAVAALLVYLIPRTPIPVPVAAVLFGLFCVLLPGISAACRYLARVPWFAWAAAVILGFWLFSFTNRPATLSAYFTVEQAILTRWPVESQKRILEKLAPALCRVGILHPARIQTNPGVSFFLDPHDLISVSILRGGEWQPEVWDSILPELREGAVFLDVGAHIGYFSMRAAPLIGKSGRVLAFEPNPETLGLLRDNVAANHADNVLVQPIACTDREQMLTLYAAPSDNTGASSLARENADLNGVELPRPYLVRGRPIDDVIKELHLTRVDVMKVDVEGAEVFVLRGAVETLKRFHPKVVIEIVASQLAGMHTTVDDLIGVLKDAGYVHSKKIGSTDWEWTAQ